MDGEISRKIKMIVFDVDGTLAETDDYLIGAVSGGVCKLLPFLPESGVQKVIRLPVMAAETVVHSFYRLLDLVGLDRLISVIHSKLSVNEEYKYEPVDFMRETLAKLAPHYVLGIISSGGRKSTMAFIRKYELTELVPYVISAEDAEYIKPHPEPLLQIAKKADVFTEHCILVGDTIFDILCAKRAGALSAAVKTGFDSEFMLKQHHPDLLLESVRDLPSALEKLGERVNLE